MGNYFTARNRGDVFSLVRYSVHRDGPVTLRDTDNSWTLHLRLEDRRHSSYGFAQAFLEIIVHSDLRYDPEF